MSERWKRPSISSFQVSTKILLSLYYHFCCHHHSKYQKHHHHNFIELSISLSLIPVMSRDIVSVRPPHQEPGPSKAGKKRNRWSWSACFTYQVHHHQSLPLPFTIDIITIQNMPSTYNKAGKKRNRWNEALVFSLNTYCQNPTRLGTLPEQT